MIHGFDASDDDRCVQIREGAEFSALAPLSRAIPASPGMSGGVERTIVRSAILWFVPPSEKHTMKLTSFLILASFGLGSLLGPGILRSAPTSPSPLEEKLQARQDPLQSSKGTQAINPRRTPIVEAVEKAGPSVVSIKVGTAIPTRGGTVQFREIGEGSGVIVDEEGLVITNWHVLSPAHGQPNFAIRISLRNGTEYWGRLLSRSQPNDLALVRIVTDENGKGDGKPAKEKKLFRAIQMADSSKLMVGESVIAIGNPKGQSNTVTAGVLSALGRRLRVGPQPGRPALTFEDLIQVDAAINPGNSGGALLDITGKLIGINTLIQTEAQNIGFAIPVNTVRKVFESTLLAGSLPVSLGLTIREDNKTLFVEKVESGGPAWRSGLRGGEHIMDVGGRKVESRKDYTKALLGAHEGVQLTLRISRGGTERRVNILPWTPRQTRIFARTGLLLSPIDPSKEGRLLRRVAESYQDRTDLRFGFTALRITEVQEQSPGAELGLRKDDILVGYRREDVWGDPVSIPLRQGMPELENLVQALYERAKQTRGRLGSRYRSLEIEVYRAGIENPLLYGSLGIR